MGQESYTNKVRQFIAKHRGTVSTINQKVKEPEIYELD